MGDIEKGHMTAAQWEPVWEHCIAELDTAGLARSTRELLLAYLRKSGPQMHLDIQKDQRPWPDGEGGTINRRVATWEEAHKVALELEGIRAGQKALLTAFTFGSTQSGGGGVVGRGLSTGPAPRGSAAGCSAEKAKGPGPNDGRRGCLAPEGRMLEDERRRKVRKGLELSL